MSIPYFESFNGKPPIVQRVPAIEESLPEMGVLWPDREGNGCLRFYMFTGCTDVVPKPDVVAALTRDAIDVWANSVWDRAPNAALAVLRVNHHSDKNRFAHYLVDAVLENEQ